MAGWPAGFEYLHGAHGMPYEQELGTCALGMVSVRTVQALVTFFRS